MSPKRIQRRRTRGWKMPEGAVYVGRPTRWGNPYAVTRCDRLCEKQRHWHVYRTSDGIDVATFLGERSALGWAVHRFRGLTKDLAETLTGNAFAELRGRDLACWCPLDQPCHADVLLEYANGGTS